MYKATGNTFTVSELIAKSAVTKEEIERFLHWLENERGRYFSIRDSITINQSFIDYASTKDCFINWLQQYAVLRWEESEKTYKVGDRFIINNDVWMLIGSNSVASAFAFVNLGTGKLLSFNTLNELTLKEFNAVWIYAIGGGEVKEIAEFDIQKEAYQYTSVVKLFRHCYAVGSWDSEKTLARWISDKVMDRWGGE